MRYGVFFAILTTLAVGCSPLLSQEGGSVDVGAATHTDLEDSRYISFEGAFRRGESSAPVVVVEFVDFDDCRLSGHLDVLEQLLDERDEQLQLAVRHAPPVGDRESLHASMAVEAARQQNKFWEMRRLFAESCPDDARSDRPSAAERAMNFARQLDLDLEKFRLDANHPQILEIVQRDQQMARSLDVVESTRVFVNGKRIPLRSTTSIEDWNEHLDGAWQRGLELLGEGTDWSQIYREDVRRMLAADPRISQPRNSNPPEVADLEIADADLVVGADESYLTTVVAFVNLDDLASAELLDRLDRIRDGWGDEVRLVVKFGRHPTYGHAEESARAVMAADQQARGWEMLMALRKQIGATETSCDLEETAEVVGLDNPEFDRDLESAEISELVFEQGARMRRLGAEATPVVYVNGERWTGGETDYLEGFGSWFETRHRRARQIAEDENLEFGNELYRELLRRQGL